MPLQAPAHEFSLIAQFPDENASSRGTATTYRTEVTTTRLSRSHVFLGASVKHSSCFSRSCETL